MQKIAIQLGPLPVTWFGLFVATAFLAGLWTASRRALRENISPDTILDLGPVLILSSIVGARTLYVISYWKEYFAAAPWTEVFKVYEGGLVFYGGLIGTTLAAALYIRWKKLAVWKLGDILAPSIPLGQMFGRFGCLMNGCCYGRPTELPWAIHFPDKHETHGVGVHPTQVYEAVLSFALFALLSWLHRRKKFDGQIFALYLIGYALVRSVVELFRGDYPVLYLGGKATPAHLVSIAILAAGLVLYAILRKRPVAVRSTPGDISNPS